MREVELFKILFMMSIISFIFYPPFIGRNVFLPVTGMVLFFMSWISY